MKIDEFLNRKKLTKVSIARHQCSEKGGRLKKTGLFSHRAFRGLVLVLLMSLMGTFPESAPTEGTLT